MSTPDHPLRAVIGVDDLGEPLVHPTGRALRARLLHFGNGSVALEIASVMPDGQVYAVRIPSRGAEWLGGIADTFHARCEEREKVPGTRGRPRGRTSP